MGGAELQRPAISQGSGAPAVVWTRGGRSRRHDGFDFVENTDFGRPGGSGTQRGPSGAGANQGGGGP